MRATPDAGIIRIRRFNGSPDQMTALQTSLLADYPKHRTRALLVFDLRGNGGGNDGPAYDWASLAARGTWIGQSDLVATGERGACATWNYLVENALSYPDSKAAVAALDQERPALRRPAIPGGDALRIGLVKSDAAEPYGGKIVVLLDRGSGSSGESASIPLKRALGALLVGERSAGFLEYGNLRTFVLPATGVSVALPSKRNFLGAAVEGVGFPVDAYLEDAGAPADQLLPALRKLVAEQKQPDSGGRLD